MLQCKPSSPCSCLPYPPSTAKPEVSTLLRHAATKKSRHPLLLLCQQRKWEVKTMPKFPSRFDVNTSPCRQRQLSQHTKGGESKQAASNPEVAASSMVL